ncbi:MAG TPA: hypothetical protein VHG27_09640 [Xanthobacteraceae bacterium]|nr:hypothetical protein [Xanthobacteraceae bacterium]
MRARFGQAMLAIARRMLRRYRMRQLLREISPEQFRDIGASRRDWSHEAAKWFWEP